METGKIAFVRKVGIERNEAGQLTLELDNTTINHMQTIHAGALFTLAESSSGDALQECFPELVGKVTPIVRDSKIKFRKPALTSVTAIPSISAGSASKFKEQLQKRNRSIIAVDVVVVDSDENVVCNAVFNWFVLGIEQ